MNNCCRLVPFLFFLCSIGAYAQNGAESIYRFLHLAPSARIASLGESLITVYDDDVNLAYANPSLLNPTMNGRLAFNHNFFLDQANHGYFSYGHHIEKWNLSSFVGLKYINYGDFTATDVFGDEQGQFQASEMAVSIGLARRLYERLSLGVNLNFVQSSFERYGSMGLATDLAASYILDDQNLLFSLVVGKLGGQITGFADIREPMVPNIQLGMSKRLSRLPFRYSIIMHSLNRWNLLYDTPDRQAGGLFGPEEGQVSKFGQTVDLFFRHVIVNGEFLIGKYDNLRLRIGYNHQRRRELSLANINSFSGFSYGIGFKINRFRLDYGYAAYHIAAGTNHISISTNLSDFAKKNAR